MKTIFTPRDELVCGKLDKIQTELQKLGAIPDIKYRIARLLYTLNEIRYDCERMESKLIERKVEVKKLEDIIVSDSNISYRFETDKNGNIKMELE
jgi:hypothetical protein